MPRITPQALRVLTEERRKQILDAAVKVFVAQGYGQATIANIAREAGVAEGSIYNYFKNKEALLICLPRHVLTPPIRSLSETLGSSTDSVPFDQTLTIIAQKMVEVVRENAFIFRILLLTLPRATQATRKKYLSQNFTYAAEALETLFRAPIDQGIFRKDLEPKMLGRFFIGMFFPFVMLYEILQVRPEENWDYDEVIANAVSLFLRGVLVNPNGERGK